MADDIYDDGVKLALSLFGASPFTSTPSPAGPPGQQDDQQDRFYGQQPKKKSWLPAIAAAGVGGALAYKHLRTPSFSSNPALKGIQEQAQKGFHRVADVSQKGDLSGYPLLQRAYYKTLPQVNNKGELDALNKAKLWFHEGNEVIPAAKHPQTGKATIPGRPNGVDVDGYVFDRTTGPMAQPGATNLIRGGQDIEGTRTTQQLLSNLGDKGKGFETQMLSHYAPDAIPKSFTNIPEILGQQQFKGTSAQRAAAMQKHLLQHASGQGVDHFALKPTHGVDSGGHFATSKDDWGQLMAGWDKHMAQPGERAKFDKHLTHGSWNDVSDYLHEHDLYPHYTVNSLVNDPKSIYAQHWMPGALGEWRVHTAGGTAPSELIMPRNPTGGLVDAAKGMIGGGSQNKEEIRQFVEKQVLGKMPEHYRKGMYGMDVMPFRKPDGSVEFKVMELNPHGMSTAASGGGGSGLLEPEFVPGAAWKHYRAMTGRHAQPVAAAGALGAAGIAGAGARLLTPEEDDDQPHPVG